MFSQTLDDVISSVRLWRSNRSYTFLYYWRFIHNSFHFLPTAILSWEEMERNHLIDRFWLGPQVTLDPIIKIIIPNIISNETTAISAQTQSRTINQSTGTTVLKNLTGALKSFWIKPGQVQTIKMIGYQTHFDFSHFWYCFRHFSVKYW